MMNQVESTLPLTVGPFARAPWQVSLLVEEDSGPRYIKQEGNPRVETECARPAT
jgi:hypothetical protein